MTGRQAAGVGWEPLHGTSERAAPPGRGLDGAAMAGLWAIGKPGSRTAA